MLILIRKIDFLRKAQIFDKKFPIVLAVCELFHKQQYDIEIAGNETYILQQEIIVCKHSNIENLQTIIITRRAYNA